MTKDKIEKAIELYKEIKDLTYKITCVEKRLKNIENGDCSEEYDGIHIGDVCIDMYPSGVHYLRFHDTRHNYLKSIEKELNEYFLEKLRKRIEELNNEIEKL